MASGRKRGWLFAKGRRLYLHGLATLVIAAHRARVVGPPHGAALRAARQARQLQRQVAASLALTRLWVPFLGQWWHYESPSLNPTPMPLGIDPRGMQSEVAVLLYSLIYSLTISMPEVSNPGYSKSSLLILSRGRTSGSQFVSRRNLCSVSTGAGPC